MLPYTNFAQIQTIDMARENCDKVVNMKLKKIVSVSLGAKKRDKTITLELLGQRLQIERRGTDGDFNLARAIITELDGKVAAIGLGGIDRYVFSGNRRYVSRDANRLALLAKQSPVVDGSGLKNTLERSVVYALDKTIGLRDKKVMLVMTFDRFGMAEALVECGAEVIYADLMFLLGLPIPIRSHKVIKQIGHLLLPVGLKLPITWFYPTGTEQHRRIPKFGAHYEWADILAGDFHYIFRHSPHALSGKTILTNTITPEDVNYLKQSGVSQLITTTPCLNGRHFGANVIEAMIIALAEKHPENMLPADYFEWIEKLDLRPHMQTLQE